MKRIALVDTCDYEGYPTGGQLSSIRGFLSYISYLQPGDVEVVLIGIKRKEAKEKKLVSIGGIDYPFFSIYEDDNDPNRPRKSLRKEYVKALFRNAGRIRRMKVDLFYIHTPEAFWPLQIIAPKSKKAVFSHGSFFNIFDKIRFAKYNNRLVKVLVNQYIIRTIRKADLLFVLDESTLDQYKPLNSQVFRVYNGIDVLKYERNVPVDEEVIKGLFVGRLSANKHVERIIEAFLGLDKKHRLMVVGDGEEADRLSELLDDSDGEQQVKLLGKKSGEELVDIYQWANILVMCSDVEGLPMVIIEAYAAGLGVVSTRVGAIGDILENSVNGYISDGTVDGTREAIELTFESIRRISTNNIQYSENFDYRRVNADVYKKLSKLLWN